MERVSKYNGFTLKVFYNKVKKDKVFKELDLNIQSVQSLPGHYTVHKCY